MWTLCCPGPDYGNFRGQKTLTSTFPDRCSLLPFMWPCPVSAGGTSETPGKTWQTLVNVFVASPLDHLTPSWVGLGDTSLVSTTIVLGTHDVD